MADRRRAPRYILHAPLAGYAIPILDVVVERRSGLELTVISSHGATPGDTLVVHFSAAEGEMESHEVQVQSSTPVLSGALAQFRLKLRLTAPLADAL